MHQLDTWAYACGTGRQLTVPRGWPRTHRYANGEGVETDMKKALKLNNQAARAGNPMAQFQLASAQHTPLE